MYTNKSQIGVPRQRKEECKAEMRSSWNSCQKNDSCFTYTQYSNIIPVSLTNN